MWTYGAELIRSFYLLGVYCHSLEKGGQRRPRGPLSDPTMADAILVYQGDVHQYTKGTIHHITRIRL